MQIHSVIDVITNSSTELFVCDKEKTKEMVEEILSEFVSLYNKHTKHTIPLNKMLDVFNANESFFENNSYLKEDYGVNWKGEKILIEGKDDNSIPYWMFDLIEDLFNARRFHLG